MLRMLRKKYVLANRLPLPRRREAARPKHRRNQPLNFESLEPRLVLGGSPIISEFMAINNDHVGRRRRRLFRLARNLQSGRYATVDLTGWQLQDSGNTWTLPAMYLDPGEFRLIFASGKDRTDPAGRTAHQLQPQGRWRVSRPAGRHRRGRSRIQPLPGPNGRCLLRRRPERRQDDAGRAGRLGPLSGSQRAMSGWTAPGFNDAGWPTGATGLGFPNGARVRASSNYRRTSASAIWTSPCRSSATRASRFRPYRDRPGDQLFGTPTGRDSYHDPVDAPISRASPSIPDGSRTTRTTS